jgi:hypothetical protein
MIFEGVDVYMNPAHLYCVSLNMTCGVKLSEPSLSDSHHPSPSYLSLTMGSTGQSPLPFLFCCKSPLLIRFPNRKAKSKMGESTIGDENLQTIYHWKALDEENTLGRFIFGIVHYKSLASKGKRFECKT